MTLLPRAEHVGSLLRPAELLEAREALSLGELEPAAFKQIEDRGVRDVLRAQAEIGLPVVTDGEYRRESFQAELAASVDGIQGAGLDAWLWGEWHSDAVGDRTYERPGEIAVVRPLRRLRSLAAEEFVFVRAHTDRISKITLPSPSLYANLWTPERSREAYATLDDFLADVTAILCDEVRELERLGCRYVQLDAPHYPLLVEPAWQEFYASRGWPLEGWIARGVELDNAVIAAAPDITFGFHLCRGNQASRWLVSGSYEPIARAVFGAIRAQRLLLEYDDDRSGGFEPLRFVRDDAVVVLGLVTTKTARRETVAELVDRARAASRHVPLERLAIGTQCGFATSVLGNAISADDQWRKLRTIVEAAEALWG